MDKLARDVHERKVVLKAVVRRRRVFTAIAPMELGSRQMVDILINNYYSDKDNLRSRTEDYVDAKCALSTLFLRPTTFHATLLWLPRACFLFFFFLLHRRTTNEGIGGRSKMLKWMKEE